MKKKLLTVTLAILMVCNLAACGGNGKDSEETVAVKTVEEETSIEKTVEAPATEEQATVETTVVEEVTTTEYQLTQMDTGFYGGIAWATVSGDVGSKHVLINKDLQVVYELPEGMETGDIFDGKAVVIYSDQTANPGFIVLGTDGNVLYECTDVLCADEYPCYNVNFTKDGSMIYEKHESGLTGNKVTACILNSNYEKAAELEISMEGISKMTGCEEYMCIDFDRKYVYLSDGIYGSYVEGLPSDDRFENPPVSLLNVKENTAIDLCDRYRLRTYTDMDRCVGLSAYVDLNVNRWAGLMGDAIDYNGISDADALCEFIRSNGKEYTDYDNGNEVNFKHGYILHTEQEGEHNITSIEGFTLPDFGAPINKFWLSDDGRYASLSLKGADGNTYTTVIGNDGQKLYEPVVAKESGYYKRCVCDGYILTVEGEGLTPEGKEFKLGDGTALAGIGESSTAYIKDNNGRHFQLSDGYIVCQNKLYSLDGTEVTTVTAVNQE